MTRRYRNLAQLGRHKLGYWQGTG